MGELMKCYLKRESVSTSEGETEWEMNEKVKMTESVGRREGLADITQRQTQL